MRNRGSQIKGAFHILRFGRRCSSPPKRTSKKTTTKISESRSFFCECRSRGRFPGRRYNRLSRVQAVVFRRTLDLGIRQPVILLIQLNPVRIVTPLFFRLGSFLVAVGQHVRSINAVLLSAEGADAGAAILNGILSGALVKGIAVVQRTAILVGVVNLTERRPVNFAFNGCNSSVLLWLIGFQS